MFHSKILLVLLLFIFFYYANSVTQCYRCSGWVACEQENIDTCEDPNSLCVSNSFIGVVGRIREKRCVNSTEISTWQDSNCPHYNSGGGSCYLCDSDLCNWLD